MPEGNNSSYEYKGVELTPNVFGSLALQLFDGQKVRRAELAEAVASYHFKRGGIAGKQGLAMIAKKALNNLAKQGLASKTVANGIWLLSSAPDLETQSEATYKYKDIVITGQVFGELAMKLFNQRTVKSDEIMRAVMEYHLTRGGLPQTGKMTPLTTWKAALRVFGEDSKYRSASQKGFFRRVHGPYWYISSGEADLDTDELPEFDEISEEEGPEESDTAGFLSGSPPFIYAYDFPTHANHAESQGITRWAHKIGFTATSPESRVAEQINTSVTAIPEYPRITFQFQHRAAAALERTLHTILELRGQKLENAPGSEWFLTNPAEIQSLIDWIFGSGSATSDLPSLGT